MAKMTTAKTMIIELPAIAPVWTTILPQDRGDRPVLPAIPRGNRAIARREIARQEIARRAIGGEEIGPRVRSSNWTVTFTPISLPRQFY